MFQQKGINWILFIVLALLWGSSFILMKRAAVQLSGWQIGAIRIFSAGLVFLPFGIFHCKSIPKAKLPIVVLTGFLGNLFPAFLFGIAIQRKIESSLAGILNSLTPLFVLLIGVFFFKVVVQRKQLIGVLVGFVGLLVLSILKGPVTVNDVGLTLLILLATLFYGLNVNIIGTYLKGVDPIKMATVSLSFLTLPAGIVLLLNPVSFSKSAGMQNSILSVIALGILGSAIATAVFYLLIKKAGGLFASLVTYAVPVVAIFWGILANENMGTLQIGCLGIILAGVYLANK
jgi:drug/metabolite transporter (DMT)-like permease